MNENPLRTQHHPDVDGLLRDFFRAEMPTTWPRLQLPAPAPVASRSPWRLRFALAASVALVLTSYLGLAGQFPRPSASRALELNGPVIGNRPERSASGGVHPRRLKASVPPG
jgi:hypothetical protein